MCAMMPMLRYFSIATLRAAATTWSEPRDVAFAPAERFVPFAFTTVASAEPLFPHPEA